MALSERRLRTALLLRTIGAGLLFVGGVVLVLVSLWGHGAGIDRGNFWTGVIAIVAGLLFGVPLLRSRR